MTRPRWHKVLDDLFSHKIRSLLVITSVGVGLFAIGMISVSYYLLSQDIRSGYKAVNPANIQIRASLFDQDFVRRVTHLTGVQEAQGVRNLSLRVRTTSGEWKPISVKAQTEDDMREQPVNRLSLVQGEWPPGEKKIVLDKNKLSDTGAAVGDMLEIRLPSGTIRRMELVGIVQDLTIGSSGGEGGFFLAPIQGYIDTGTLAWLEQPEGFNTLFATVQQGGDNREAIQSIAGTIVDEFDKQGISVTSQIARLSTEHPNLVYVDAMAAVIYLLGFLVVFLSGFLITNTLSALLNQQVQQIGVMKTIGASRWQIIAVYMVLILVFSLISLAIAIPLSRQAAYALMEFMAGPINVPLLGYRPVPQAVLLQVLIALVVPQVAGSLPILQGTRISVREALSGTTTPQIDDNGPVYRILARIRGLSRPMLISLRNTFRRRARLALTLLTLTLGGAIFIATFNVRYSMESYIARLGHYFLADVNVVFSQPYRVDRVIRDILQVPEVAYVEGWSAALAQIIREDGSPGANVQILAPPEGSRLIEPILLEGRWIQPGDQNAITLSEVFRNEFPNVRVGDTIRLNINQKESEWVVVGFFQFAGRSSGLFAYTNFDSLARETGLMGRSVSFRLLAHEPNLSVDQQEALGRRVEAHLIGLGYETSEVLAGKYLQDTTSEGLDILTTFLLIMSLLMAVVGSIGLMGTMSLNVMERTREIGVMRAIGGSNRRIINIVLVEGGLIGFISWLLACGVALPITKLLADAIFQIVFDTRAALAFTFSGNLIWFGLVTFLSILASVIPAYNASRLTIREVLAYE